MGPNAFELTWTQQREDRMSNDKEQTFTDHMAAVGAQVQRGVGRLEPERAYGDEHYWDDRDEPFDEPTCPRCHGDGMDPWWDYLLPCPDCQGEQTP